MLVKTDYKTIYESNDFFIKNKMSLFIIFTLLVLCIALIVKQKE